MTATEKVLGVIPARYESSRFPGKPLALIAGRPMIERVCRQAGLCRRLDRIVVATDDERIAACVKGFGGEVLMTPVDCPTGTDRTALAARAFPAYPVVLNIQGDEPLLEPEAIDSAVELMFARPAAGVTTLVRPARSLAEVGDPNYVKVVLAADGRVLYFSRGQAPFCRSGEMLAEVEGGGAHPWRIHIGLYVWRREALFRQVSLPLALIERSEGLEQLRAMHAGIAFYAADVAETASIGVDQPQDVARIEALMREKGFP